MIMLPLALSDEVDSSTKLRLGFSRALNWMNHWIIKKQTNCLKHLLSQSYRLTLSINRVVLKFVTDSHIVCHKGRIEGAVSMTIFCSGRGRVQVNPGPRQDVR